MAGYIGKSQGVTQVDGYTRDEADAEYVNDPNAVITVSGSNVGIGATSPKSALHINGSASLQQNYSTYLTNAYYDSGWKYIENGFAWGIGNNFGGSSNGVTIATAPVNASGNDAGLTWSPRLTIDSSGHLNMTGGGNIVMNNGSGIDFSAVEGSGATSSVLDDYEEGTWTPSLGGSTTQGDVSYTSANGQYTKIGNVVFFSMYIQIDTITTAPTGTIRINGLPYAVGSIANERYVVQTYNMDISTASPYYSLEGYTVPTGTRIQLIYMRDNSTWVAANYNTLIMADGDAITITGKYLV